MIGRKTDLVLVQGKDWRKILEGKKKKPTLTLEREGKKELANVFAKESSRARNGTRREGGAAARAEENVSS